MKSVNTVTKEFHVHHAVFRQVPFLVSKNSFKQSNIFWFFFFKSTFGTLSTGDQTKLWVKDWCTCNLQCFDHVCNLLFIICNCLKIFFLIYILYSFEKVGWTVLLDLSLLWRMCLCNHLFLSVWSFQLYFIPWILPTTLRFLALFFRSCLSLIGPFNHVGLSLYESLLQPWYNP